MRYVLSLDVGTSSVRACLYDEAGQPVTGLSVAEEHQPETTPDGGVEMDPEALFQRSLGCMEEVLALAGDRVRSIAGVGVCTFWHSILGVAADGRPVTPILMWADTRSVAEVEELKETLDWRQVHQRTGCPAHTSYAPPKLLWAAKHRPDWLAASTYWLSPGEYFFLRLFGERACGISMASGTGLYNQAAEAWDEELLRVLPITPEQLSPIVDADTAFQGLRPEFARRLPALAEVPWFPAAGDGACSNVGSGCVGPDRMALMVGTSGALRVMRDRERDGGREIAIPDGLWRYRWDRRRYLLGGALSNGGNLFAWLQDTLRLPPGGLAEEALAAAEPDGHGLTVLPFLAGERSPGWRGDARAAIVGLAWHTRPEDILQAGLEAVAYRFALIHDLLEEAALPRHQVIASGGALLASPVWTQMMADVLGHEILASEEPEASVRGAALLALEGLGLLKDLADAPARTGRVYRPDAGRRDRYTAARARQQRLYRALITSDWARP